MTDTSVNPFSPQEDVQYTAIAPSYGSERALHDQNRGNQVTSTGITQAPQTSNLGASVNHTHMLASVEPTHQVNTTDKTSGIPIYAASNFGKQGAPMI